MQPEETPKAVPKGDVVEVEIVDRREIASQPQSEKPPLDAARVKRMAAFFKYTRTYWGIGADGSRGEPLERGGGTMEHMDATVIDGINIGEVYRELKDSAVKRMREEKIEDAPSVDDLEAQWEGGWE